MPAFRRYEPSVAPVDITGTTGTPGHIWFVSCSIAASTSARIGDGLLAVASPIGVTEILESSKTRISVDLTSAGDSPGSNRQFTMARAVCGNALSACPPSRRVATHVVRSSAFSYGSVERRAIAPLSLGFLLMTRISAANWPAYTTDILWKYPAVTSFR